ncbi:MAG: general secretion pathway protein GspK, partial [Planctomycetes bacterium]|nr:general secretion pathway protein GspK [Planctomycetota bacterium]
MKIARRQSGFIVLIVMVVIVMITLAGLAFVLNLSVENKAVHLQGDQRQLQQTLASGVEMVRGFLAQPPAQRQLAGGLVDNRPVFSDVLIDPDPAWGATRFSVISPPLNAESSGGLRFGLQNESARLNLAVLSAWDTAEPGAAARALMNLPGMTEPIADAILDWLDGDASPRPSGAEAEYYTSRGLPYEPRNGLPAVLDELLLVRDVSRASLFGADANFNYRLETDELQQAEGTTGSWSSDQVPWARLLTLYSGEQNRTSDGAIRIYLNDADLASLHRQLTEAFDRQAADFVVAYRQFGPFDPTVDSPPGNERVSSAPTSMGRRSTKRRTRPPRGNQGGPELDLSSPAEYEIGSVLDLIEARVLVPWPTDFDESQDAPSRLAIRQRTSAR